MVNPAQYQLDTEGKRTITIEPVYEEIGGGDLLATGRYILSENNTDIGEIRFAGEAYGWEWDGNRDIEQKRIRDIIKFIQEYNEPELAQYVE